MRRFRENCKHSATIVEQLPNARHAASAIRNPVNDSHEALGAGAPARTGHLSVCFQAVIGALYTSYSRFWKTGRPRRTEERVAFLTSGETAIVFIAEQSAGAALGFVNVLVHEQPEIPIRAARKYAEIANLVVRVAARRGGVGLALIAAATEWAKQKGFPAIELRVHGFNDGALRFFESAGFRTSRRQMSRAT